MNNRNVQIGELTKFSSITTTAVTLPLNIDDLETGDGYIYIPFDSKQIVFVSDPSLQK